MFVGRQDHGGNATQSYGGGIDNTGRLTIDDSTISGNSAAQYGGGIENDGSLTINDSTISGNTACCDPEGGYGGGIYNTGTLTIDDSTFSGNSADYGGGGIFAAGSATLNNSTLSANSGGVWGGGIMVDEGTVTVNNATISGNSAGWQQGGGVWRGGESRFIFQNTILAKNSGKNCFGILTSQGYNLSSDKTCHFNGPGDLNNTKAKLGKLGNHGGPTQTIMELLGSPTIDAGNPNGCTDGQGHLLTTDQRGFPRPGKNKTDKRCDMGAYERQTD